MEIFFFKHTFITKNDAKKLGKDMQGKVIHFNNKIEKECTIIGYEKDDERYVEIWTESRIDKYHKNIVFMYIIYEEKVMIGNNIIEFKTPIMQ
jgi:hypothetical protein